MCRCRRLQRCLGTAEVLLELRRLAGLLALGRLQLTLGLGLGLLELLDAVG